MIIKYIVIIGVFILALKYKGLIIFLIRKMKRVTQGILLIVLIIVCIGTINSIYFDVKNLLSNDRDHLEKDKSDIDICKCLTEPYNSEWSQNNLLPCRDAISKEIGVDNWEKINFSKDPYHAAKFETLSKKCAESKGSVNNSNNSKKQCEGFGSRDCIIEIRKLVKGAGKEILGEQYEGEGIFQIQFFEYGGGTYNATYIMDCDCKPLSVKVSRLSYN